MEESKFYKDFFDAFVSYYSYFGLVDDVRTVKDYIIRNREELNLGYVSIPYGFKFVDDIKEQLWCILVLLYGDYGVAPRWGWIEDIDSAVMFLKKLEELLTPNED